MSDKTLKDATTHADGQAASGITTNECCGDDCCDMDDANGARGAAAGSPLDPSTLLSRGCCDPDCCA